MRKRKTVDYEEDKEDKERGKSVLPGSGNFFS
jgi:hypothetical protein